MLRMLSAEMPRVNLANLAAWLIFLYLGAQMRPNSLFVQWGGKAPQERQAPRGMSHGIQPLRLLCAHAGSRLLSPWNDPQRRARFDRGFCSARRQRRWRLDDALSDLRLHERRAPQRADLRPPAVPSIDRERQLRS